jgi:spore coat polysaccharide biosynthesis predicted glycosyltransferase SpsG
VIFAVADEKSAVFVESRGGHTEIIGGNCMGLGAEDGTRLALVCRSHRTRSLLVDSYAVSAPFFSALRRTEPDLHVVYIDDLFNFSCGRLTKPALWDVDVVIAYGFGLENARFEEMYSGTRVKLFIGTRYAPLKKAFAATCHNVAATVQRTLITTGSTNPNGVLELMTATVLSALPDSKIDAVMGALSDSTCPRDARIHIQRGLTDLSPLMRRADLAVSAAGTTLYELCAAGVPSVVVPIVENQLPNADGFEKAGLGVVVRPGEGFETRLYKAVESLALDTDGRKSLSAHMRSAVDGKGSERVAKLLVQW